MPKTYHPPATLITVGPVTVYHTYKAGCSFDSDKQNGYLYTLDEEQAEPGLGTSHHFDVRNLPLYDEVIKGIAEPIPEEVLHAAIIFRTLAEDPFKIPLGGERLWE